MPRKLIATTAALCIAITQVGCGTYLHPERKGQSGGRLDPAIVAFDGLGLLLFIIPGVIAFVVDFSTGAIYLPEGESTQASPQQLQLLQQPTLTSDELAPLLGELGRRQPMTPNLPVWRQPLAGSDSSTGALTAAADKSAEH